MNHWNVRELIPHILHCGRVALSYFESPEKEFKSDDTVVTLADKAIESYLATQLNRPESGSFLLGEETIGDQSEEFLTAAFQNAAWITDPIDGTAPFSNGLPNWCVSLGFMNQGVLQEGIILIPVLGELYYTDGGQSWVERLGTEPTAWEARLGHPVALKKAPGGDLPKGSIISLSQYMVRYGKYNLPYQVQITGSSVFHMVRLAAGSYSALLTRFRIWDFAGCLPLLANLGWTMVFHGNGLPMSLTMDEKSIINVPGHPDRWSTLDHVVFAPGPEGALQVRQGTSVRG